MVSEQVAKAQYYGDNWTMIFTGGNKNNVRKCNIIFDLMDKWTL
jgi:hypothetical protein